MTPLKMLLPMTPENVRRVLLTVHVELTIGRRLVRLMNPSKCVKLLWEFTAPFRI